MQVYPDSYWQVIEHPSPATAFPSSHVSPVSNAPSPHIIEHLSLYTS